jgi:ketosteroid isomerase-like protein
LPDGSPRNGIFLEVSEDGKTTNFVFKVDIGDHGFFEKPKTWTSRRASPGRIQQLISRQIAAHERLRHEINDTYGDLGVIQKSIDVFKAGVADHDKGRDIKLGLMLADQALEKVKFANDLIQKIQDSIKEDVVDTAGVIAAGFPESMIAGLAAGGDLTSAGRSAVQAAGLVTKKTFDKLGVIRYTVISSLELAVSTAKTLTEFFALDPLTRDTELRSAVEDLVNKLGDAQERWWVVNERVRELDDARRAVRAAIAEGDRVQAEREVFRQRAAAVVQGYRTRDAAFRLFRNEKLERYKTLFDLSAQYALLAANAYDYETGLLGTSAGRNFKARIIASRALGVVQNGEPQFAGSNAGDPGLSSALAEMKADWDVLRGRLGINRPDPHSTTVSYRTEKERILPGPDGDANWKDVLNRARKADILADPDVRRFCMQIDSGNGLPVPGLVLTFSTTIADGLNLFGQPLAAGDHAFSPSFFANKIGGVGVALIGYRGMGDPSANGGAVAAANGTSPGDPSNWFLDPLGLAATPYIYLIPVGVDSMRSPPLGDTSQIRTWNVQDLAIPMPFNIGGSEHSTKPLFQSGDSLAEPLFGIRKHNAFRPVSDIALFELVFYSDSLPRHEFIDNRLVGRSVWNSKWKLIIPGRSLLNDPEEGLDRFIQTVKDIKINFTTYSYSGN